MRYDSLYMNSEAFILSLNNGDAAAFEMLFRLYHSKLRFIASNYISQAEDSEEIVQDVFIKIWKRRKSLNIKTNLNSYLFTTVKNTCLDHLRKQRRKTGFRHRLELLENTINYNALKDAAASAIIEKELALEIEKAIALLPEKCKQVFMKSRVQGMTNKAISEQLHISVKTVENHMTRALRHMRLHLQDFLHLL
ncbi:RNA polymerase sigma-70 factor [Sungkyunkwania multivorans]|uniref:RNA polymerase sigma-70 factor n=1 Tax=Sungkyunkwania multivorans TaxID=1173618 RepID=A0ABW3CWU5_9FLAO